MKKYVNARQVFDNEAWANGLTRFMKESDWGRDELADMLGVSESTINHWIDRPAYHKDYAYPSMTNFLKICYELSLRAENFFTWRYEDDKGNEVV